MQLVEFCSSLVPLCPWQSERVQRERKESEGWRLTEIARGKQRGKDNGASDERNEERIESSMTGKGQKGSASHRCCLWWKRKTPPFCTNFTLSLTPLLSSTHRPRQTERARVRGEIEYVVKEVFKKYFGGFSGDLAEPCIFDFPHSYWHFEIVFFFLKTLLCWNLKCVNPFRIIIITCQDTYASNHIQSLIKRWKHNQR